jgi:hypothetical protein
MTNTPAPTDDIDEEELDDWCELDEMLVAVTAAVRGNGDDSGNDDTRRSALCADQLFGLAC